MFENLRIAFQEAVKNFKEELHRDEVPETVDRLLRGMKQEAADARSQITVLEQGIERAKAQAAHEAAEARTCRRRESMALAIADAETARLAAEYAERHERRKRILEQKAVTLAEELTLLRADVEEMIAKIREADRGRDGLAAAAGRTQARESVRGGDPLFEELDRMADLVSGTERERSAAEELGAEFDMFDLDDPPPPPGPDLDARLAELKRRMGKG